MATATAHIKKDHYKTHVQSGENSLIADEPANKGGTELGFASNELVLAGLGACTAITLRMYADRKGYALDEVKVHLSLDWNKEKTATNIVCNIELIGNLSSEEKERLLLIANKCPTRQLLANPINIETKIV